MKNGILSILVVLVLAVLFVAGLKIQGMQIGILRGELTTARNDADRWQRLAENNGRVAGAQAALADTCLKREAQTQADRDSIADIIGMAKPQPITPEQAKQGVDDATRTRAVDMLNRPW